MSHNGMASVKIKHKLCRTNIAATQRYNFIGTTRSCLTDHGPGRSQTPNNQGNGKGENLNTWIPSRASIVYVFTYSSTDCGISKDITQFLRRCQTTNVQQQQTYRLIVFSFHWNLPHGILWIFCREENTRRFCSTIFRFVSSKSLSD